MRSLFTLFCRMDNSGRYRKCYRKFYSTKYRKFHSARYIMLHSAKYRKLAECRVFYSTKHSISRSGKSASSAVNRHSKKRLCVIFVVLWQIPALSLFTSVQLRGNDIRSIALHVLLLCFSVPTTVGTLYTMCAYLWTVKNYSYMVYIPGISI